ncbi:unnamed protein product [Cochlearia groenlandica]
MKENRIQSWNLKLESKQRILLVRGKGLYELDPSAMSRVQLLLAFEMLEGLMIVVNDKLLWQQVMLPSLQSSHQRIKLFVLASH